MESDACWSSSHELLSPFLTCFVLTSITSSFGLCLCAKIDCRQLWENVVKVCLPFCWVFGKHSVTTCQVSASFLFICLRKLSVQAAWAIITIHPEGERRGREDRQNWCPPRGRLNETGSLQNLRWREVISLKHLTCAHKSSGVCSGSGRGEKTWKECLHSRKSLTHLLPCKQTESWEIIHPPRPCLFPLPIYISSIISFLSLTYSKALLSTERLSVFFTCRTLTFAHVQVKYSENIV